ncbi:unnamed protein product [Lasius platythorax]|uniref:Uncharacterized protein n=1 Tax=Lasius platythorax TaxID=488582 RepID=A0AAV2N286_9HYME
MHVERQTHAPLPTRPVIPGGLAKVEERARKGLDRTAGWVDTPLLRIEEIPVRDLANPPSDRRNRLLASRQCPSNA